MTTWAPCLRHRHYRIYFLGQLANWFGTWIQQLALGWWAYKVSGSVGWLAAVGACSQLPILILGPWAASLADHIERRRGVMITQALSLAQAAAMLALYVSGKGGVEAIVLCSLFLGVVNTFDIPIRQSYAAHLIPAADLKNAIAISAASSNFARLAAPSIGGLLIAWAGEGACFAVNTASFLAILCALRMLPKQPPAAMREEGHGALALFAMGARHAAADPWIVSSMVLASALSLFATPYLTMMPALMRDAFNVGPELYGLAMGASGVGAMFAGLAMAARPKAMGKSAMPWLGVLGAASLTGVALAPSIQMAMPLLGLAGFGLAGSASSANALVQARVDPAMRGRVMGLFSMCLYGAAPIGVGIMGYAADVKGARFAVASGALIATACCLGLAASAWRRARMTKANTSPVLANSGVDMALSDEHAMVLPLSLAAAAALASIEVDDTRSLAAPSGLDGGQVASEWDVPGMEGFVQEPAKMAK